MPITENGPMIIRSTHFKTSP